MSWVHENIPSFVIFEGLAKAVDEIIDEFAHELVNAYVSKILMDIFECSKWNGGEVFVVGLIVVWGRVK